MTEYVRLGDVAEISAGGTPNRGNSKYWYNGTIPWVKIGDIQGKYITETEEKITEEGLKNSSAKIFPKGTILFSIFATIGNVGILEIEASTNQAIAGIQFNECVDNDYAYYYLSSLKESVARKGRGAAQQNINQKILKNIEIPLPSLEEQKRIAAALDRMSSVIAKRKRQIGLLDEAAKSLFVEMFGDPVENPMGWDVDVLNNLGDIISGITKGRKTTGKTLADIPYMRVANVKDGHLDLSEIKLIGATAEEIKKYSLQEGDVLLTEGGDNDKLGRGALWKGEIEPCIHQNHIFRVRAYPDKMFPKYFAEYLKSSQAKLYFLKSAKQTTGIASINMRQLSALPVVLPPLPLQEKFVERIGKLEQQKISCERGLKQMETAFAAMMQEYFG